MNDLNLLFTDQKLSGHIAFWTQQLNTCHTIFELIPPTTTKLPTAIPEQKINTFSLTQENQATVQKLAQGRTLESFIILLTAYYWTVFKYTHQNPIIFNTPLLKQGDIRYNAWVTLIENIDPNKTIKELIIQINQTVIQSYKWQGIPLKFIQKNLDLNEAEQLTNFYISCEELHEKIGNITKKDLHLHVHLATGQLTLNYHTSHFTDDFINAFTAHFQNVLQHFQQVNTQLRTVSLLSPSEYTQLITTFNQTTVDYPRDQTIVGEFEQQVIKYPHKIAVVDGERQITYAALNARVNQIAHFLRKKYSIQPDDIIALMFPRSLEMIIAILGVLKSGAAYLPLDPDIPNPRKIMMLEDTQAKVLFQDDNVDFSTEICPCHSLPTLYTKLPENIDNPQILNRATDLVYVIYTSGSTGKPKGVQVEQRAIIRLVKNSDCLQIDAEDKALLSLNYAFDASTCTLFGALLNGATLYLLPTELLYAPEECATYLIESKIDTVVFSTAFFNQMAQLAPFLFKYLKKIYFGGEAASAAHVQTVLAEIAPNTLFANVYGPTENGVISTYYPLINLPKNSNTVPIGKPIANSAVYVLDQELQPVPIGVDGELYLGGDGVARGYLHRPDLTAEKFINNPFKAGERLYRSGDIGKWLPDGNLLFTGRMDEQVKIRGFRIELGEITSALLTHPDISQAFVTTRLLEEIGEYELLAYFVSNNTMSINALHTYLSQYLPDYMLPAHCIRLERLPLNRNGKVDKNALPPPELDELSADTAYEAAHTPTEAALLAVWSEVLGRKKIGIHDSYFALGGDSIKAIQIATRLHQRGLKVEVRDIFMYETISELAQQVTLATQDIPQTIVTGEIPLTPIQKWLFAQYPQYFAHFNQSVVLFSANRLSPTVLQKALNVLVVHHDVLRTNYYPIENSFIGINHGLEKTLILKVIDLQKHDSAEQERHQQIQTLHASFNLETDILIKAALFQENEGDYLAIVAHHLIIDGVSWRILLEDLQQAYEQIKAEKTPNLPPKTHSFKAFSEQLHKYAKSDELLAEISYWQQLEKQIITPLKTDFPVTTHISRKTLQQVSFYLNATDTALLTGEVNNTYRTEINDILLTGLAIALYQWQQRTHTLLRLEGHGRENIGGNLNIQRTIGWFTSVFPLMLHLPIARDIGYQIKTVKENLRQLPNKGVGYGILRYLTQHSEPCFTLEPQISFNYLGDFSISEENSVFKLLSDSDTDAISPEAACDVHLDISSLISNGELHFTLQYSEALYTANNIEIFIQYYQQALQAIIHHCLHEAQSSLTPSDVDFEGLNIDELDDILAKINQ